MRTHISEIRRERLRQWFADRSVPEKEKSYLSQLMGGKASFGERAARRLERDYGMGDKYLDTPIGDIAPTSVQAEVGYISFELLDIQAAAGNGKDINEFPEVVQHINVLESWAHSSLGGDLARIKLISARGTSMQGTIENGDVLFVDASIRAFDGDGIYVIARGSDVIVKRLQKLHGDMLAIISDNRAYRTEELTCDEANSVIICGRVLAAWSLKKLW